MKTFTYTYRGISTSSHKPLTPHCTLWMRLARRPPCYYHHFISCLFTSYEKPALYHMNPYEIITPQLVTISYCQLGMFAAPHSIPNIYNCLVFSRYQASYQPFPINKCVLTIIATIPLLHKKSNKVAWQVPELTSMWKVPVAKQSWLPEITGTDLRTAVQVVST